MCGTRGTIFRVDEREYEGPVDKWKHVQAQCRSINSIAIMQRVGKVLASAARQAKPVSFSSASYDAISVEASLAENIAAMPFV